MNIQYNKRIISILFPDVGSGWKKSLSRHSWLDPHFLSFKNSNDVVNYCISHQIQIILAVSLKSHRFLIKHHDELKKENIIFLSNSSQAIDLFGNKKRFYQFMVNNKLGVYMPIHYTDIKDVQYPCVVKKTSGLAGRGQRIVHSAGELGNIDEDELVTEYIEGHEEYATHILYNKGRIIRHVTLEHNCEDKYYIAGQAKRKRTQLTNCDPSMLQIFDGMLKEVNYFGFCCFDYKIINRKPILFEVNARMGYSLSKNSSELQIMIKSYINESVEMQDVSLNDYKSEEIQSLMLLLIKVNKNYVSIKNKILYSDFYNPCTKTLSIEKLEFSSPMISDEDLDAIQVVLHCTGSIDLSNNIALTCLDGLNNIQTISGKLIIQNTGIKEINGLNEIQEIGSLIILNNTQLENINGLTNLRTIGGTLSIRNNKLLVGIQGINSLQQVTEGDLEISDNINLKKVNGLSGVRTIGKSLILEKSDNLTDIKFLSSLNKVKNILLNRLKITGADSLRHVFENGVDFPGYIKISHSLLSDLIFMRGVKSVGSSFYLHNNQLSDLSGLENLEHVGASFSLMRNKLSDISQLSNLKEVDGMIGLANNKLITLQGLENVKQLKTIRWNGNFCSLNISGNPQLKDISALSNIKEIDNNIILLMNAEHHFTCIPELQSNFARNTIQVFNHDFSLIMDTSTVCQLEHPDKLTKLADYEIVERITKSTSLDSVVFLVKDKKEYGHQYVLKLLNGTQNIRQHERELNILQSVNQFEGAIKLHDFDLDANRLYLLFEHKGSVTLQNYISQHGILPEVEILKILNDLIDALLFFKQNQILHLDLWPETILYNGGKTYLIDFSLSWQNANASTFSLPGVNRYLAPEAYRGKRSYASDLYSLGCVIYHIQSTSGVNGMFGLKNPTTEQLMFAKNYLAPQFNDQFPSKLRSLVLRMLEPDPLKRIKAEDVKEIITSGNYPDCRTPVSKSPTILKDKLSVCSVLAKDNNVVAQNELGKIYEQGRDVEKDIKKAMYWYKKAAEKGYSEAQCNLGMQLLQNFPAQKKDAVAWIRKAASNKYNRAQFLLAKLYESNQIQTKSDNHHLVLGWYKKAAENGCRPAVSKLLSLGYRLKIDSLESAEDIRIVTSLEKIDENNSKSTHHIYSATPDIPQSHFPSHIYEFPQVKNPIVRASDEPSMNGEFVADPFLFKEADNWYLFYEVMDKDLQYGVIGFSSSCNGIEWKFEEIILKESFHLSYPYVFKYNDKYYMIPETNQTRSVRLYEATGFPYKWEYKTTLLQGFPFVDASIFTFNNKFWMFVSTRPNRNCYLYYSDNLFNCWKEHPQSPVVKNDKSKARPAGRILQLQNGRIIRTSQKCDVRYGQKVRAFEVVELTENIFKERELSQSPIFSDTSDADYKHRIHHFDAISNNNTWHIVSDRKGRKTPWCIDLYTASSTLADKEGFKFLSVLKVTAKNDNTDIGKRYLLENLIEGCGKGFESSPPYGRISKNSWSTRSIKQKVAHYFDGLPEPIILNFEFENIVSFDGFALWANRFNYGNSIKDFTLQFSCSGKHNDLSTPVKFTSSNSSYVQVELFKLPQTKAKFVRLEITSNHCEEKIGGDRVGFHEIAFIKNYAQVELEDA